MSGLLPRVWLSGPCLVSGLYKLVVQWESSVVTLVDGDCCWYWSRGLIEGCSGFARDMLSSLPVSENNEYTVYTRTRAVGTANQKSNWCVGNNPGLITVEPGQQVK